MLMQWSNRLIVESTQYLSILEYRSIGDMEGKPSLHTYRFTTIEQMVPDTPAPNMHLLLYNESHQMVRQIPYAPSHEFGKSETPIIDRKYWESISKNYGFLQVINYYTQKIIK